MSNFTVASTVFACFVVAGATALAIAMWRAADRIADRRLRWIAAAFGVLAVKGLVSIYSIQSQAWHHEVAEMVGSGFDVAIVACVAAPFLIRK